MNSRSQAAFVVARWIATQGYVSEMIPPGPDRAFVQDLVYTVVRRFRPLRNILGELVPRWPKGELEALLLVGGAQLLYMPDVPDFAAVNETVAAAKSRTNEAVAKAVNAVLINHVVKGAVAMGIKYAETGPQLETNHRVRNQWNFFKTEQHKRRRCYVKALNAK